MVHIEINEKDSAMVNIFTVKDSGEYILWGVVHKDILAEFNLSPDHIDEDFSHLKLAASNVN